MGVTCPVAAGESRCSGVNSQRLFQMLNHPWGQGLVRGRAEPFVHSKFLELFISVPERELHVCKSRRQTFSPKEGVHANGDAVKYGRAAEGSGRDFLQPLCYLPLPWKSLSGRSGCLCSRP